jgi:exopolysaccharide biosynthesis operon protein EpsL
MTPVLLGRDLPHTPAAPQARPCGRRPRVLTALALGLSAAAQAQITPWADPLPEPEPLRPLSWQAGAQWQHDNNVLRSSQGPVADHIWVANAGMRLDKTFSQQRLELQAKLDAYRYQRSSSLDFNALNYLAAWHWALGPAWSGRIAAERRQWVDRLGDASASGLIRRTETAQMLQAQHRLGADWRALGGLFERRQDNTDPSGQEPDTTLRGGELGLRYVLPADHSLSYRLRQGQGSYSGSAATVGDFTEREHAFDWNWSATGQLRLQGQFGHLARDHAQQPGRDFSGWVARAGAQWELSGKTSLGAGLVRELAAYQTLDASYYEGDRLYVAPQWQAGVKTLLRLRLEQGERRYKGALPGALAAGRQDRLRLTSLELQWQALRSLSLTASAQRDQRRSNQAGADYRASILALSAQASF